MPYVGPTIIGTSVFLYGSADDAKSGTDWGGSGFLVGVPVPSETGPAWVHLYAATNDHVVHNSPVVRLNNGDDVGVLDGETSDWTSHPDHDDVAVRPLGLCHEYDYAYARRSALVTHEEVEVGAVGPGDDCLMVGRYIGRGGRQFERPVVRFGNVSMSPPEMVWQAQRGRLQESFLVDMRSLAGFSGSPVWAYYEEPGWRLKPGEKKPKNLLGFKSREVSGIMSRTWLLGIDWGHLPVTEDVVDEGRRKVGEMTVNSGMAAVVPAWKLADLLDAEVFVKARKKAEEELENEDKEGGGVLDAGEPEDELGGFTDLARKLIAVPKEELDKERAAEKKRKG
jgi:hypothetical protein